MTVNPTAVEFTKIKQSLGLTVKLKWDKVKCATGYEIEYSTDRLFKKGDNTKTVKLESGKTEETYIEGLEDKKMYYMRIRVCHEKTAGKKPADRMYYSKWSKTQKIKVHYYS